MLRKIILMGIIVIFVNIFTNGIYADERLKADKIPAKNPLKVIHSPNPTDIYISDALKPPPYENMWFYETSIENMSNRKLKIIWFESYFKYNDRWYANNILGRALRNDVFRKWYGDLGTGDIDDDGWIKPGGKAFCKVNWHYSESKEAPDCKWCFIAIDKFGNDYYVEKVIKSVPKK